MGQKLAVALVLLCVSSAIGQTRSDFEKKYGTPIIAYPVSENIWMTPEYTKEGQVCMIRLHPQRFSPSANYISTSLPFKELQTVLNELLPLQTRGPKKEPFDSGATGGGVEWIVYAYENVKVTFVSPFYTAPDSWKTREKYTFSVPPSSAPIEPKEKVTAPSENDFSPSKALNTEIVTVRWNGRQCALQ